MPAKYLKIFFICALILGTFSLAGCSLSPTLQEEIKSVEEKELINQTPTEEAKPASSSAEFPRTSPPPMEINPKKQYTAVLKTTQGDIVIKLNAANTPKTVNNFVYLAKHHFYDHTIFHRVIKDFMIQGGDPRGDGTGGPGYQFADEPFTGKYTRGVIAMANSGPNTNGSQFFIMHKDYPLPPNYVIFGEVIEGMETVDKIASSPVKQNPLTGETSFPVNPTTINSVEIIEK